MKMIIDKQTFEKVVFAANVYVFDAIQDRFEQAEHKLFGTVLGSDTDVDTLPVKEDVCRYICLDAFYQAIPGLDLILTDTGFGIVNNQNIRHHVIGLNRCACRYSVKRIIRWTVLLRV